MLSFFTVPDQERAYQKYMVFLLTIVWSLAIGIVVVNGFYFFPENRMRWFIFIGVSLFIGGFNLNLNRIGHTRIAAWSMCIMIWLFIGYSCYTTGGIMSPGILAQMSITLTGGFLLGWRAGLAFGLLSIGTDLWLAYMEISGQLPEPSVAHTPLSRWMIALIAFATLLALQYYYTRHLNDGLRSLRREINKRQEAEKLKDQTVNNLGERIKELKTLFEVSRILRDDDAPQEQIFSRIVNELPPGWQFPELAVACVSIGDKSFVTPGFKPSDNMLYGEMETTKGTKVGVEINYPASSFGVGQDIFLNEERRLLNVLVDMITSALDRRERKAELQDFRHALDIAALVSIVGVDARFTYVNENFCKVSQYSAEELLGASHDILWSGYHSEDYIIELGHAMENGKPYRGDFCNKAKDGSLYWVDSTVVPFLDEEGEIYQFLTINYDITPRIMASKKLKEREELYKSIIEVSNTGAWEYHQDTNQNWFSPQYLSMLGLKSEDRLWRNPFDNIWVERLHPDDKEESIEQFRRFLESDSTDIWENFFRMRHQNGNWLWIWSRAKRLRDEQGMLTQTFLGTHIDISEHIAAEEKIKENERLLQKITSQVPGNTYMFEIAEDGTSKILFMSKGADTFDYGTVFDELSKIPNNLLKAMHEDDKVNFREAMKEAYRSHSPISLQYRIVIDGVVRWRWMQAIPEDDKNGKTLWYGVTSDIGQLVEYIASIEQMIFDLGHVIRRPLSTMLSMTQIISSSNLSPEEITEISNHLHQISQEMDKFIRELNSAYHQKRLETKLNIDVSSLIDSRDSLFE